MLLASCALSRSSLDDDLQMKLDRARSGRRVSTIDALISRENKYDLSAAKATAAANSERQRAERRASCARGRFVLSFVRSRPTLTQIAPPSEPSANECELARAHQVLF